MGDADLCFLLEVGSSGKTADICGTGPPPARESSLEVWLFLAVCGTLADGTSAGVLLVLPKPTNFFAVSFDLILIELVVSSTGVSPSPSSFLGLIDYPLVSVKTLSFVVI